MLNKIINWFRKEEENDGLGLPQSEKEIFFLKLDDIHVGILECKNGSWYFQYSDAFKQQEDLNKIPGFSDLNKIYTSESLWPFFQIRIPGLGQPAIKDIIKEEKLDFNNEAALLKRFGHKTISLPYRNNCKKSGKRF